MISALVWRIASEEGLHPRQVVIETRNGTGGVAAAFGALETYVRDVQRGDEARPDILVVVVDSDCDGPGSRRAAVDARVAGIATGLPCIAVGTPDPHIERWYVLDAAALKAALGKGPAAIQRPDGCDHSEYKRLLKETIEASGATPRLGGYEYADLIVGELNLYNCGQDEPEFARFTDALRNCFRTLT